MAGRRDWFFLQNVTQAEMDDADAQFEREFSRQLGRLYGRRFMGPTPGVGSDRRGVPPGSIFSGGVVQQNSGGADKTIHGSYLVAAVASEDGIIGPSALLMHDDATKAPIVATHGDPAIGFAAGAESWTYDFTADIAGIGGGNGANFRVYAVLKRAESDARIDGNGLPVNFKRDVDMEIQVDKSEGTTPHSTLPALRTDTKSVHLCTVGELLPATTTITDSLITHQDRLYNGLTSLGHDQNGPGVGSELMPSLIHRVLIEDSFNNVTDTTKTQRAFSNVTHGRNYAGGNIAAIPSMSATIQTRLVTWGYLAHDGDPAAEPIERVGLYRDLVIAHMRFIALAQSDDLPVSGVAVWGGGMTTTGDATALTNTTVGGRWFVHNGSGVTVDIYAQLEVLFYDLRSGLFTPLS